MNHTTTQELGSLKQARIVALREFEAAHKVWMNTPVWTEAGEKAASLKNETMAKYVSACDAVKQAEANHKTPSEVWAELAGKAHLYKRAKWGKSYVQIVSVVVPGTFCVRHNLFGLQNVGCHEMTEYTF